jgi:hypothetical protein
MHWELFVWFWVTMSVFIFANCELLPAKYYEYSIGLSATSALVCLISNLSSGFRINLMSGAKKYHTWLCGWDYY